MDISQYRAKERINHKHLLTLMDYAPEDIFEIVSFGIKLKHLYKKGVNKPLLKNKTLAMIFSKSSTRTRVSFEQGIRQLGGHALFLSASDIQLGRGETIHDTAKTLSRYGIDGVMIRTFLQSDVVELAKYGDFSVINGLTDDFHPCQALADIMTVYEVNGRLKGLKLAYSGDGNNVANSLILACAKTGVEIVCLAQGYEPKPEVVKHAQEMGQSYHYRRPGRSRDRRRCRLYRCVFQHGAARRRQKTQSAYALPNKPKHYAKGQKGRYFYALPARP